MWNKSDILTPFHHHFQQQTESPCRCVPKQIDLYNYIVNRMSRSAQFPTNLNWFSHHSDSYTLVAITVFTREDNRLCIDLMEHICLHFPFPHQQKAVSLPQRFTTYHIAGLFIHCTEKPMSPRYLLFQQWFRKHEYCDHLMLSHQFLIEEHTEQFSDDHWIPFRPVSQSVGNRKNRCSYSRYQCHPHPQQCCVQSIHADSATR